MDDAAEGVFGQEPVARDLDAGAVTSGLVVLSSQGVKFFMRLGMGMAMARLIGPEEFGVYVMADSLVSLIGELKDFGLSAATIQRETVTHRQVSNLFWVNTGLGLGLTALAVLAAPGAAMFYHDPRMARVSSFLALSLLFYSLSAQHRALLQRQMRFVTLEATALASLALSATIMIVAALRGAGYWAYAAGWVANAALTTLLTWAVSDWRPSLPRLRSGTREMLAFGGSVSSAGVAEYLHRNVDNILVGRYCSSAALGLYSRSYTLMLQPLVQVFRPLESVVVPALSRLQSQPDRFRAYAVTSVAAAAFFSMPLVAFLFVDTRPIILVLVGRRWLDAVPIFRALAPAAFLVAPYEISNWVLLSLGRVRRLLKASAARCLVYCLSFVVGLHWGTRGVAASYSMVFCLSLWPLLSYSLSSAPLSPADVGKALWRPALASLVAAGAVACGRSLAAPTAPLFFVAALDALIFAGAYLACWGLMREGRKKVAEIAGLLKSSLQDAAVQGEP